MNLLLLSSIFLLILLETVQGATYFLSEQYQLQEFYRNFANQNGFVLEIFSRYSPFGSIRQVGPIGLYDSNCSMIVNIVGNFSNLTNFLYYDCLDDEEKQISKHIQFIGSDNKAYNYQVIIPNNDYENQWFYFTFISMTNYDKVTFILLKNPNENFLFCSEDIKWPFIDLEVKITIGGGFLMKDEQIIAYKDQTKFQSFLGKLYYGIGDSAGYSDYWLQIRIQNNFQSLFSLIEVTTQKDTQCESNYISQSEININFLNIIQFSPENRNIDTFCVYFWIKFVQIFQVEDEFVYQIFTMHSDSKNALLTNDNLSAFQLFYKIFKNGQNQIIFTTYSYDLPLINLDFSQNQFLIIREFEIQKELLYSWQSISAVLDKSQLQVQINFYNQEQIASYLSIIDVNHFYQMKFYMRLGNIKKSQFNYINFFLFSFIFDNCVAHSVEKVCHPSCQQCDGPTSSDCISCEIESNRLFLPQYKACICPYNMVDNGEICLDIQNLEFNFLAIKNEFSIQTFPMACNYGYYLEKNETCVECPSFTNKRIMTNLECITNPDSWQEIQVATKKGTILIEDQDNESTFQLLQAPYSQALLYDGNNVIYCKNCLVTFNFMNMEDTIYQNFQEENQFFKQFCQTSLFKKDLRWEQFLYSCYYYKGQINACVYFILKNFELVCKECIHMYTLKNGQCQPKIGNSINLKRCIAPNYLNSQQKCIKCNILYCIYCFEYQNDNLTFSTLYKDFKGFNSNAQYSIGCALCEDGFQFNFIPGKCEIQNIQIEHCLRSFINLDNLEICTLSDIADFSVAQEIINCQDLIPNCFQCVKTPQNFLQCIICDTGYCQSLSNACVIYDDLNVEICLEGDNQVYDNSRISLIQSFLMSFLPNKYYYPMGLVASRFRYQKPYKCKTNYVLNSLGDCELYCETNCLECQENIQTNKFECKKCPLDYYRKNILSQISGKCLICPQLCLFCQPRIAEQIQAINPYFIMNQDNEKFTYSCIKKLNNSKISIDSNLIAQYNFQVDGNLISYTIYIDDQYLEQFTSDLLLYQDQVNVDFLNQMGIKEIEILFLLQSDQNYSWNFIIQNDLKESVFPLQIILLTLKGTVQLIFFNKIFISHFDVIKIEQINIVSCSIYDYHLQNYEELSLKFIFQNNIFHCESLLEYKPINFNIQADNLEKFHAQNITFRNLNIFNSSIFDLNFYQLSRQEIFFQNIHLENCNFTDTTIFAISNILFGIDVHNITIENCQFFNSTIFHILANNSEIQTVVSNFQIRESTFTNTIIFKSLIGKLNFINTYLLNNQFNQSIIFQVSQYLIIKKIDIIQNLWFKTQLFNINPNDYSTIDEETVIENISFLQNQFFDSSVFLLLQSSDSTIRQKVIFRMMTFEQSSRYFHSTNEQSLIQIQNANLEVFQLNIFNSDYFHYFDLTKAKQVSFINVIVKNQERNFIIPNRINCVNIDIKSSQLMVLEGFQNIKLVNVSIENQVSFDSPFIKITSNLQFQFDNQEEIIIKNLSFQSNVLLKTQSNIILSSLTIQSSRTQSLEFYDLFYFENVFHQMVDDTLKITASLIYVDSIFSSIAFKNVQLSFNYLTNSSSSYFFIQADEIIFENFNVTNHNVITYQILNEIYNYTIQDDFSHYHLNQIFSQIFIVKNVGGVCQLMTQKFKLIDGFFQNISAQSSGVFYIVTKGQGLIRIYNTSIQQIIPDITLSIELQGSLSIDAFDSNLDLFIKNLSFIDNLNKFGSPILSIIPSQLKNKINIIDVIIQNCISLANQLFNFEFQGSNSGINKVQIANFSFIQNEFALIEYFNQIEDINIFDLQKILSNYSIIRISGSEIELSNTYFSGVILGQLIKIINSQIFLYNLRAFDIQQIYQDNLIQFEQNEFNKEQIKIFQCEIKNFSTYSIKKLTQQSPKKLFFKNINKFCLQTYDYFEVSLLGKSYFENIQLLQEQSQNLGSIIQFSSSTNQSQIQIIKLNIIANLCPLFVSALAFLLNAYKNISISELNCVSNNFKQYGCLNFYSESITIHTIKVKNSFFFHNEGVNGSSLNAENVNLNVIQCYFFNNTACEHGGAIHFQGKQLILKNSYIFMNRAQIGGGIAILKSQLTLQLNSTFLLFNKASTISDNILSEPTHLSLLINDLQMPSELIQFENKSIHQLLIKPYKTIDQESIILTKYLMLPANQLINNYQKFNPHNLQYYKQIQSLQIALNNIYNEVLPNSYNYICEANQQINSVQGGELKDEVLQSSLAFDFSNNMYALDQFKIIFDPFIMNDLQLILQTQCSNENTNLFYRVIIKIYKCQLGEYYIERVGCQICDPVQRYYSVQYNVTKCSIFDKTKFSNITSNQIQLLPGFWRYNKYSDVIEFCFKNQKFCQGGWSTGNQLCKTGNIGGLCEECDIQNLRGDGHFFKDSQNLVCWDCNKSASGFVGFFLILLWSLFSAFLTLDSVQKSNELFQRLKLMRKFGKILFKLNQDQESLLIKMLINYLWIFSAIFTFNIQFSFKVNAVEQVSNPSVFMASSLDCSLQEVTQIQITYFRVIVTFLLIFAQFFIVTIFSIIFNQIKKRKPVSSLYSNVLIYLYLSNNGAIIKLLSSLLASRSISDVTYIQGNVSLLYYSEEHLYWLKNFIIPSFIISSFIVPMLLLLLLMINQKKLDIIEVRTHLSYLFHEYREAKFYWELVKIFKQSIIIFILTILENQILLKAIALGFILILYQLLVTQQTPFQNIIFNKLDIQSGLICTICIFLAAIKYQSEQVNNKFFAILLSGFIVFLLLRLIFPFAYKILVIFQNRQNILLLKKIQGFCQLIKRDSIIAKYLRGYINQLEKSKNTYRNNIDKLRAIFLKKHNKTYTLTQKLSPSTMLTMFSPQNNAKQQLNQDLCLSSQKIEL